MDLPNDIAAEARAKITYAACSNSAKTRAAKTLLMFLRTREIAHMKSFMRILESLGKDALEIGQLAPDPKFVNKYFNATGPQEETDAGRPWNTDGFESRSPQPWPAS